MGMEIELCVKFMLLQSRIHYEYQPKSFLSCQVHHLTRGVMNSIKDISEDMDNIVIRDYLNAQWPLKLQQNQ
jgi:hypothetical protein